MPCTKKFTVILPVCGCRRVGVGGWFTSRLALTSLTPVAVPPVSVDSNT